MSTVRIFRHGSVPVFARRCSLPDLIFARVANAFIDARAGPPPFVSGVNGSRR